MMICSSVVTSAIHVMHIYCPSSSYWRSSFLYSLYRLLCPLLRLWLLEFFISGWFDTYARVWCSWWHLKLWLFTKKLSLCRIGEPTSSISTTSVSETLFPHFTSTQRIRKCERTWYWCNLGCLWLLDLYFRGVCPEFWSKGCVTIWHQQPIPTNIQLILYPCMNTIGSYIAYSRSSFKCEKCKIKEPCHLKD